VSATSNVGGLQSSAPTSCGDPVAAWLEVVFFFHSDSWGSNPLQEISVHELLAKDKVMAARQWLPGEGRALTRSGRERGHSCPRVGRKNRSVQTEGGSALAPKVSQQTMRVPFGDGAAQQESGTRREGQERLRLGSASSTNKRRFRRGGRGCAEPPYWEHKRTRPFFCVPCALLWLLPFGRPLDGLYFAGC